MEGFQSSQSEPNLGSREGPSQDSGSLQSELVDDDWRNGQTPSHLQDAEDDLSSQDYVGVDEAGSGREMSVPPYQRQLGMDGNNNRSVNPAPQQPPPQFAAPPQTLNRKPLDSNQASPVADAGQRLREPCCIPLSKIYSFYHCIEYHKPEPNKEGFFWLINKDRKDSPLKLFRNQMVDLVLSLPAGLAQLDKFRQYRSNPPDVETQCLVKLISRYTANSVDKVTNQPVETSYEVRLTASTGSVHIKGPSLWVRRYYFDKNFQEYLPTYAGVKFVEGDNIGELMKFVKESGQVDYY